MADIDAIVVGAGVVGLACAAALARAGRSVIVLEQADGIGTGVSSRNSEVVHAGIYYPTGSFKHLMCVRGRRLLYDYMATRGVAHRKCGKFIVATAEAEIPQIEAIHARAEANGVENLRLLSGAEAMAQEPQLACVAAIESVETGIMDSHGLMLALQGELEDHGGAIAFSTPIAQITPNPDGSLTVRTGGEAPTALTAALVVNAAGLYAHRVAGLVEGLAPAALPPFHLAKGSYFGCAGRTPFTRLIYPAPVDGGLGVHITLDLAGRMRFGPDVEWLDHADPDAVAYDVDIARADQFYAAVRRYWPGLPDGAITPDYAGCRPKLSPKGAPAADFQFQTTQDHGVAGLINLLGIESPGLTSALAIAEHVQAMAAQG